MTGRPGISPGISIGGYVPGALGQIVALHATWYAERWDFGAYFEAKVAADMAAFITRPDDGASRLWCARQGDRVVGSVAIDGVDAATDGAHLRWFIIAPDMHGRGLGRQLLAEALGFCRQRAFPSVWLSTFAGLDAARHLYEAHGFRLTHEAEAETWGRSVREQRFELDLRNR